MKSFPENRAPIQVKSSFKDRFYEAWGYCRVLFFSAPCGFGKTTSASALLSGKDYCYLNARMGFDAADLEAATDCACLVIDDSHELVDIQMQSAVKSLLETQPHLRLVVLSRGPVPSWLSSFWVRGLLKVFGTTDLAFDAFSSARLVGDYGVKITAADLGCLMEETNGYPLAVAMCAAKLSEGNPFSSELLKSVKDSMFEYLNNEVFLRLDQPTQRLLMCLSLFGSFTSELACAITQDDATMSRIRELRDKSSMFVNAHDGVGELTLWGIWGDSLRREAYCEIPKKDIRELYFRGGNHYLEIGQIAEALACFEKADRPDMVRKTLIDNAMSLVNEGNYRDAESFYMRLTDEEVESSPVLIFGMSVLSSMQMRYEKAEKWRMKLLDFANDESNKPQRRDEARLRHAFLRIVLPQYPSSDFIDAVKETRAVMEETGLDLPKYSLTAGEPSFINGSRDFSDMFLGCENTGAYEEDFEKVFGRAGVFFLRCAKIEYGFMRGELKESQLNELLMTLHQISRERIYDLELAAAALIARGELSLGNVQGAIYAAEDLLRELQRDGQPEGLVSKLNALKVRAHLYASDDLVVSAWLAENASKHIFRPRAEERYESEVLAVAYIAKGEHRKALYPLTAVMTMAQHGNRQIDMITGNILSAICHKNLGEEWKSEMREALELAEKYGYVSLFAQFGDAVQPLLGYSKAKVSQEFFKKTDEAVRQKTAHYPRFLKKAPVLEKPLTETEQRVLELLCEDMSNAEIGRILNIKLPTVKTHVSHVFAKLGCKRRADARSTAIRMGLV